VDDVIHSAFGSAGQRCSALRILCVQEDIAPEIISMIKGAMEHLVVGEPCHLSTDIGPIIDDEAKSNLVIYRNQLEGTSKDFYAAPYDERLDGYGHFFTPIMAVMDNLDDIVHEAFGPVLHIITFKEKNLDTLIHALNAKNYGLTFGLHTRIIQRQNHISAAINAGNIYINRGQTGAVVGVQPFGGRGLSGTGPKAGGPRYLLGFTTEKSISNNITASGGNTTLVNL
jgi:RHH-type proline utilization regulon transcriptional repressor/proline dehydrogenase/delta 1-pyrroline-5-carboxylate dehydrogenase